MRVTRHNGRGASNSPRHNDRDFDVGNSEHIDSGKQLHNHYWDCYYGHRSGEETPVQISEKAALTFENVEQLFYYHNYSGYTKGQNARNEKGHHPERNKSPADLLHGKRTQPEETILQVGNIEETVDAETLLAVMDEYHAWFEKQFGSHIHILDWALHADETTPHIHERHVFDFTNQYGERQPMQEKALEALGIERPDPDKPAGRNNNRKMSFDKICREKFMEITVSRTRDKGICIESEPSYGGRAYVEKQDYIIASQKERLEDLQVRIRDLETFIDEVTDTAFEKAADALSGIAAEEAVSQIGLAFDRCAGTLISKGKLDKSQASLVHKTVDVLSSFIHRNISALTDRIRKRLHLPGTAQKIKETVKEEVRTSSLEKLREAVIRTREREAQRKAPGVIKEPAERDNPIL